MTKFDGAGGKIFDSKNLDARTADWKHHFRDIADIITKLVQFWSDPRARFRA